MRWAVCFAVLAALVTMLAGCGRHSHTVPDENGVYPAEKLFDYFMSEDMPWGETKEFEVPEFPDVKFTWDDLNVMAITDGEEKGLYWGMPIWGVYLADLNGDGKREICSTVAMGSGIVDERIYAYDLVHERLYTLQDRFFCNYRLELKDGALFYVQTPDTLDGEALSAPLTLDKMTQTDKSQI